MSERDYYEILGLRFDADGTAVNRTYWLLARKYQAQAGNDPRAHQLLDELNEAYGVLGTPALRQAYDDAHPEFRDPDYAAQRDAAPTANWQPVDAFAIGAPVRAKRGSLNIMSVAPYAAAVIVGFVGVSAGLMTGSLLLAGLGAGGAILLGAAYAKHKMSGARTTVRTAAVTESDTAPVAPRPAARAESAPQAPLSASIARRRSVSADELRLSTASMVGRWRSTVAVTAPDVDDSETRPDGTLVDIFRSEDELERPSEPLSAVLDVLRGSRHPV